MSFKAQDPQADTATAGVGRRRFLNAAAVLGISSVGLAACKDESAYRTGEGAAAGGAAPAPAENAHVGGAGSTDVKPGQLDTHYGLWRVLAV